MITLTVTQIENGERFDFEGMYAEIHHSDTYVTIYTLDSDRPVGTIQRARHDAPMSVRTWTVYDLHGSKAAASYSPRIALARFALFRQQEA